MVQTCQLKRRSSVGHNRSVSLWTLLPRYNVPLACDCVAFRTGWTPSCYSVSCVGSTVTGGYTKELRVRTLAVANLPIKFTSSSWRRCSTAEFREPVAGAACPSHLAVFGTRYRIRYTGSGQPGRESASIYCANERMTGGRRGRGRAED